MYSIHSEKVRPDGLSFVERLVLYNDLLHQFQDSVLTWLAMPPHAGGYSQDHEDAEAHDQRCPTDGAGGDPQEHVHTSEKDDQGTDRMVDRTSVHEARRGQ